MLARILEALGPRRTAVLGVWALLLVLGAVTYTSLIPREGFPPVDVPIAVSAGNWLVDDTERVDSELVIPLERRLNQLDEIESLTTLARDDSYVAVLELQDGLDSATAEGLLNFWTYASVPQGVEAGVYRIRNGLLLDAYTMLVAIEGPPGTTAAQFDRRVLDLSTELAQFGELARADPFSLETTPPLEFADPEPRATGYSLLVTPDHPTPRPVATLAVAGPPGEDVRDVSARVRRLLDESTLLTDGWSATVALDVSESIEAQIGSLQWSVVFGMVVAAIITFLLISGRASLLTMTFVLAVVGLTCTVLHLLGISLNTVSLIGLILSVGLIVDDVIVIADAVDAEPDDPSGAVRRIAPASISGSITTILVFAPMLFVTGVLGDFIRQLPITVIVALTSSLLFSLLLVPPLAGRSRATTTLLARPASQLADRTRRGRRGLLTAGALSVLTLLGTWQLVGPVGFDIFPPAKDGNDLRVDLEFEPGLSARQAQDLAIQIHRLVAAELGDDLELGYVHTGSRHAALAHYRLASFRNRDASAAELAERVRRATTAFDEVDVRASQISPGPPVEDWPFKAQVFAENPADALGTAEAITAALLDHGVAQTRLEFVDEVARTDGRRFIEVQARFDDDDLSTVLESARSHVVERIPPSEDVTFDFGQEDDNDDAFASTNIAFVAAIGIVYLVLVLQFRSLIQPVLVLSALPFSLLGVFVALWWTDNTLSFFVMLGLMGLVGIALNNSILLVDAANRARSEGADRADAMAAAVQTRFRPLVATTLTTIAGLLPLALLDPFWESLAVTIIGGLVSSTILVLVALPFFWIALGRRTAST
jgi:multidrug efflux pump subunit AcrB